MPEKLAPLLAELEELKDAILQWKRDFLHSAGHPPLFPDALADKRHSKKLARYRKLRKSVLKIEAS